MNRDQVPVMTGLDARSGMQVHLARTSCVCPVKRQARRWLFELNHPALDGNRW